MYDHCTGYFLPFFSYFFKKKREEEKEKEVAKPIFQDPIDFHLFNWSNMKIIDPEHHFFIKPLC